MKYSEYVEQEYGCKPSEMSAKARAKVHREWVDMYDDSDEDEDEDVDARAGFRSKAIAAEARRCDQIEAACARVGNPKVRFLDTDHREHIETLAHSAIATGATVADVEHIIAGAGGGPFQHGAVIARVLDETDRDWVGQRLPF